VNERARGEGAGQKEKEVSNNEANQLCNTNPGLGEIGRRSNSTRKIQYVGRMVISAMCMRGWMKEKDPMKVLE
jgi:hypothetical protein